MFCNDVHNDYHFTTPSVLCEPCHKILCVKSVFGLREFFAPSEKGNFPKRKLLGQEARHQFSNIQRNHVYIDVGPSGSVRYHRGNAVEITPGPMARYVSKEVRQNRGRFKRLRLMRRGGRIPTTLCARMTYLQPLGHSGITPK